MTLVVAYGTPAGTVNAKTDFGATGDGSTDDTTALQAAITAAAGAASGGRVIVPPGVYITQPLTLPPGVVLEGCNGQTYYNATTTVANANTQTRLKLKAASAAPLISPDDTGANKAIACKILNIALDCNGINQPAINLPDQGGSISRFWTLEGVYVSNVNAANTASGHMIYIGNQNTAVTMRDCVVFNGTSGSSAGFNGIGWYGSDGRADNCFIGYVKNVGLNILGGVNDETFSWRGGGIFTCATNIAVGGGGAVFESVSIDHSVQDGVFVNDGPAVFSNCSFHDNASDGTHSNVTIAGNNAQVSLIGCRGWGSTTPRYMINVTGTGVTLKQYGNHQTSGSTYSIAWTNYAPTNAQANGVIEDMGVGSAFASSVGIGTLPTGAIVETIPRKQLNSAVLNGASGSMRGALVHLAQDTVITSLTWQAGTTALSAATHQWFAVVDTTGLVLAVTADDTSTAWAANATKTLALTAPLSIPATGGYYLAHCVVATTIPTHFGVAATLPTATPFVSAVATGQTTPPVVGSTLTLISNANIDYGYAS